MTDVEHLTLRVAELEDQIRDGVTELSTAMSIASKFAPQIAQSARRDRQIAEECCGILKCQPIAMLSSIAKKQDELDSL